MPEMTTGQAIKEALSLCLDSNNTTFIAGEDIGVYWRSIWWLLMDY